MPLHRLLTQLFKIEKIQQEKEARKAEKKAGVDDLGLLFKPVAELQKISKGIHHYHGNLYL